MHVHPIRSADIGQQCFHCDVLHCNVEISLRGMLSCSFVSLAVGSVLAMTDVSVWLQEYPANLHLRVGPREQ